MSKSAIVLPDFLYTDGRAIRLKDLESMVRSLAENDTYFLRQIADYQLNREENIQALGIQKENVKNLKEEIKTKPSEEDKKTFLDEQNQRINHLPIKHLSFFDIYFRGDYKFLVFQTNKLKLTKLLAKDKIRLMHDGYEVINTGMDVGRFLVLIQIGHNYEKKTIIINLDNNYSYQLPSVSTGHPCWGNIGNLIDKRIIDKKMGNLCETIIDYLTSPSWRSPYHNADEWVTNRKEYHGKVSFWDIFMIIRNTYSFDFSVELLKILMTISKYPKKMTLADHLKNNDGQSEYWGGYCSDYLSILEGAICQS